MGLFDFLNLDKWRDESRKDAVAIEIDVATGVLERCPVCQTVFDRERDERLPAADLEAHQAFDRNDPRVAIFNGDRDDLLARLRRVRAPLPWNCTCDDAG